MLNESNRIIESDRTYRRKNHTVNLYGYNYAQYTRLPIEKDTIA